MSILDNPVLRSRLYGLLPFAFKRHKPQEITNEERHQPSSVHIDADKPTGQKEQSDPQEATGGFSVGFVAVSESALIPAFHSACRRLGMTGKVFDPSCDTFFDDVSSSQCTCFLVRPEYKSALMRRIFDEKIGAIRSRMPTRIFPSENELRIYESKRELAYFLKLNDIPHPKTWVFFREEEAIDFIVTADFPLVFKSSRGAASSGVEILKNRRQAAKLIQQIFRHVYFGERVADLRDFDYGYALFQEFLPQVREFRIIKIGTSWFGHEKAGSDGSLFMSGSGLNKWTPPTPELLDFCHQIAVEHHFEFMCFDVFQSRDGRFLINELQTWFGSYNDSQMYIDGVPGRYVKSGTEWVFEEGVFNVNNGMVLRLSTLSSIMSERVNA